MAGYEGKRFRAQGNASPSASGAGAHYARSAARRPAGASGPRAAGEGASRSGERFAPSTSVETGSGAPESRIQSPRPVNPHAAARRSASTPSGSPAMVPRAHGMASARGSHVLGARPVAHGKAGAVASSGDRPPKKRGGKRNVASCILIGAGVVLLLVAAGIFIWAQLGYRQAAETYDNLTQYVSDSEGTGVPVVDWDALKAQSEDIVAWIYVPGTTISYPVVQGESNEQYLRALPDGTSNNSGSIMLDCDQTAPGMVQQQTTVYGHQMTDGSMFHAIEQTLDQDQFDQVTTVYYLTPETTYVCTPLFTARVEDSYVKARQGDFGDTEALQAYLTELRGYAQAQASDVDDRIASADQVLSLVTCSGLAPADHRAIMVCTISEEIPASGSDNAAESDGAAGDAASNSAAAAPEAVTDSASA